MKKVYIVKIGRVTEDWGRFTGYQIIGCVASQEKVTEKIAQFKAEHEKNQYWMSYETEKDGGIKFYVDELEVEE